jgi:Uncharacterised protein family (UPF0158)
MNSSDNLSENVKAALRQLGADKELVPGAKLRQVLDKSFLEPHFLDEFLKEKGLRFSEFVSGISGIFVQKRSGADMLVGFPDAQWPVSAAGSRGFSTRLQFRPDVYLALTRVTAEGFYYLRESDQFIEGRLGEASGVPLPKVTFSELTAERKQFAEALEDKAMGRGLSDALEQSTSPISAFQRAIAHLNLGEQWHIFKFGLLRAKLEQWTKENHLAVLPSWYVNAPEPEAYSPKAVMARLVDHMTEEEIRSLAVPFRAVESLFNSMSRKV